MNHSFNHQHINLLINAFENDPMFIDLFKGTNKHRQMKAFFNFIYTRNQLIKGLYLSDSNDHPSYVAFIETPKNKRKVSLVNKIHLNLEMLKLIFYIPLRSLNFLSKYDAITSKHRPNENHYYLTMIAVSSDKQGKGIGKQVLNNIHQIVSDNLSTPIICLDTENKNNVTYYEHLGYKLTYEVKTIYLTIYCMTNDSLRVDAKTV